MIRLDKYLADMGIGTRSEVKNIIRKKQVSVNGIPISKPETKVDITKMIPSVIRENRLPMNPMSIIC